MIGTDLNLSLPSAADTYSTAISKTAIALQAIEDSIADRATPAGLDITSNLPIGGNHLTNVGGLILASGNTPSTAGSVYYSGGNFYVKDATGVIQLTSAGAINVAGVGGIGGDYGGSNPAIVTFDDLAGEYRFKEDPSTWADLVASGLVLMETGGSDAVRVTAPVSVTTAYTMTLPAAPPASNAVLMMSAAGVVTANVTPTIDEIKHGDRTKTFLLDIEAAIAFPTGTGSKGGIGDVCLARINSNSTYYFPLPGLRTGDRLKSVRVFHKTGGASATSFSVYEINAATGFNLYRGDTVADATGDVTIPAFGGALAVSNAGVLALEVDTPAGNGTDLYGCTITWDRV